MNYKDHVKARLSEYEDHKFDYDSENDNLFIYRSDSKSKASVEMDDLILDFNSKGDLVALEILNASAFFSQISGNKISKSSLADITKCRMDVTLKNNFFFIKFVLLLKNKTKLETPLVVPTIQEMSPAIA